MTARRWQDAEAAQRREAAYGIAKRLMARRAVLARGMSALRYCRASPPKRVRGDSG
jgi:hypothetical protein